MLCTLQIERAQLGLHWFIEDIRERVVACDVYPAGIRLHPATVRMVNRAVGVPDDTGIKKVFSLPVTVDDTVAPGRWMFNGDDHVG